MGGKNNIISGYGGGTFGVNNPTTREQAVTILWLYAGEPENAATANISDMSLLCPMNKPPKNLDISRVSGGRVANLLQFNH